MKRTFGEWLVGWLSGLAMVIDGLFILLSFGYFCPGITGFMAIFPVGEGEPEEEDWKDEGVKVIDENARALLAMDDVARMEHLNNLRSAPATQVLLPKILERMEELRAKTYRAIELQKLLDEIRPAELPKDNEPIVERLVKLVLSVEGDERRLILSELRSNPRLRCLEYAVKGRMEELRSIACANERTKS